MRPTLTITAERGGCFPGVLACKCGAVELAVWTAELGTRCSKCGKCFVTLSARQIGKPGVYPMKEGPHQKALVTWVEEEPRPTKSAEGRLQLVT